MISVKIKKYQANDEYVVFFHSRNVAMIKILTTVLEAMNFSVKDRNDTSVTVRGTMK